MTPDVFAREYLGSFWEPSDDYRRAYDAWRSYHEQCDAFDRRICGPSGMPMFAWQRAMITQNAGVERRRLEPLLAGIDRETSIQARDAALRDINDRRRTNRG